MGELHLEITVDRMRTELGVEAVMGKPKVSFREAFGGPVELTYTHKKQSGGAGQFAKIKYFAHGIKDVPKLPSFLGIRDVRDM